MKQRGQKIAVATLLAVFMGTIPVSKAHRNAHAIRPKAKTSRIGKASWYSKRSPGIRKRTANNEIFDDRALTAAMWNVQFNQKVRITNLDNGKSIVVRINDRGPNKRYINEGRIIDLTKRAFSLLGSTKDGLINVQVEFL